MRLTVLFSMLLLLACGDDAEGADAGSDAASVDGGGTDATQDAEEQDAAADAGAEDAGGEDSGVDAEVEVDGGPDTDAGSDAGPSACDDGLQNGDETDVDCGGACDACNNGEMCDEDADCLSDNCSATCMSPPGTHEDIVRVEDVAGRNPGGRSWADSYSVGDECFCETTFDHNIADIMVDTPAGRRTVRQVCEALGDGPGSDERPLYNDIQCGNGPANDAGDEDDCPGRVDIGREGCGHIGPRWDLSVFE